MTDTTAQASMAHKSTGENLSETNRKVALSVVSTIFFMWGFLTCLNDILIPHLKALFSLSYMQSALIQFTFFGAYFIASLPAGKVVTKIGYKYGISLGLLVSAVGAALFYPAAKYESYPFFLAALFILATGITFLQVSANPYVSLLGSEKTAPSRLNLAQALNSLGTTVAPHFGGLLILSGTVLTATQLVELPAADQAAYRLQQAQAVQGPYLFLAGVLLLLAIFIFMFRLPSFKTEEEAGSEGTFAAVLKKKHVLYGVISQFLYVGAEVSVGSFLINFMAQSDIGGMNEATAAKYVPIFWGGAMVGRFVGSALMQKIDAGKLLGFAATIAAVLIGICLVTTGPVSMYALLGVGLFNSIMFPTIFSLGIRGLGPQTEKASSLIIMSIVGGAIIPLIMGALADRASLHMAFALPLVCYLFIVFYGFSGSRVDTTRA
jgi:FHS family L-fucose permease-like MFS transporter